MNSVNLNFHMPCLPSQSHPVLFPQSTVVCEIILYIRLFTYCLSLPPTLEWKVHKIKDFVLIGISPELWVHLDTN